MKPIPVSAAENVAKEYGYDQVIIIGRKVGEGPGTGEHVTTYGADEAHCDAAAKVGDFIKYDVMGWEKPVSKSFSEEQSSNVKEICYKHGKKTMDVTFRNEKTYRYLDVPESVFLQAVASESIGKFLHARVKGVYRFSEI